MAPESTERAEEVARGVTIAARLSRPQALDLKQEVPATPLREDFLRKFSSKINTPRAADLASRRGRGRDGSGEK
jgi:hypothetical protein